MRKILWFLAVHSGFYLRKITPQAKIFIVSSINKVEFTLQNERAPQAKILWFYSALGRVLPCKMSAAGENFVEK